MWLLFESLGWTNICKRGKHNPFLIKTHYIKYGVIHKIVNFLFGESEDSVTLNKMKTQCSSLQENQLMQQEQIMEQYELLKLN